VRNDDKIYTKGGVVVVVVVVEVDVDVEVDVEVEVEVEVDVEVEVEVVEVEVEVELKSDTAAVEDGDDCCKEVVVEPESLVFGPESVALEESTDVDW